MRPRVFKVPLQVRGVGQPGSTPASVNNARLQVRQGVAPPVNLRGYANQPGPNGAPSTGLYPYTENLQYNGVDGPGGSVGVSMPPPIGMPPPAPSTDQLDMISVPFGSSQRDWNNPTTYSTIPLIAGASGTILQLNYKRNSLIIQNTGTATSPDVAPTLYIGFNAEATIGGSLALPPGLGFYWSAADCPPRDAINVVFGPSVNGGGTVVVTGCVIQGTYSPGPYVNPQGAYAAPRTVG